MSYPAATVTRVTDSAEARIASVHRELAQLAASADAVRLAPRSARRKSGASIVFSVRLDPDEVTALEARAAVLGMKPTVLARNLIRTGLAATGGTRIAAAVDQLEAAVVELRTAITMPVRADRARAAPASLGFEAG